MNNIKRLFKSIWLRLTFQYWFVHPNPSNEVTNTIENALKVGIKGYIHIKESTNPRFNILLNDDTVLVVQDMGRFFLWANQGFLGTKEGIVNEWEDARPHIIEMKQLWDTLQNVVTTLKSNDLLFIEEILKICKK